MGGCTPGARTSPRTSAARPCEGIAQLTRCLSLLLVLASCPRREGMEDADESATLTDDGYFASASEAEQPDDSRGLLAAQAVVARSNSLLQCGKPRPKTRVGTVQ